MLFLGQDVGGRPPSAPQHVWQEERAGRPHDQAAHDGFIYGMVSRGTTGFYQFSIAFLSFSVYECVIDL